MMGIFSNRDSGRESGREPARDAGPGRERPVSTADLAAAAQGRDRPAEREDATQREQRAQAEQRAQHEHAALREPRPQAETREPREPRDPSDAAAMRELEAGAAMRESREHAAMREPRPAGEPPRGQEAAATRRSAEGEPMRHLEAQPPRHADGFGTPRHDGSAPPQADAAAAAHPARPAPPHDAEALAALFTPDAAQQFRTRWDAVQIGFVDDPARAVRDADELVAQVLKSLAESFAGQRERIEGDGQAGGHSSTEDHRLALRRYRSFFQRLLSL